MVNMSFRDIIYFKKNGRAKEFKVMTAAQREQLYKVGKRFAVRHFRERKKATRSAYDGLGWSGKCEVTQSAIWSSDEFHNWALNKKYDVRVDREDYEGIMRKVATQVRQAGYKVELKSNGRDLLIWKTPVKRKAASK